MAEHHNHPIGVIDLGSNSLRLVAFSKHDRALMPLYNEKEICEIGRGLERTGKLNPEGAALALKTLERFRILADGMGIKQITVLATEAVRGASDGRAFIEEVRLRTGLQPTFVSGEDEARYAKAGVAFGIPHAKGVVGDLGGGSLELAGIGLKADSFVSLPLGPLRLIDASDGRLSMAEKLIHEALKRVDWLSAMHKRTFYAVGGIWRAIAKAHVAAQGYPLKVVHMYEVDAAHLADYALQLAGLSPDAISRTKGIGRKRQDTLAYAALLLERLIAFGRPERICFSAMGLREGYLFSQLSPEQQQADPLLCCTGKSRDLQEAGGITHKLAEWTARVCRDEPASETRLRQAACELASLHWDEHPEYRARQAYQHALALPVGGIDHLERCQIALTLYVRYAGEAHKKQTKEALGLLPTARRDRAITLGLVLRLAYELTGGAGALLEGTSLKLEKGDLVLTLNVKREGLLNETVERRLAAAAEALHAKPKIIFGRA